MATSSPYLPPIGAICTARRLSGKCRVISHCFDGHVMQLKLQSLEDGKINSRFHHEVTELNTSSYMDVEDFMQQLAGISQHDLDCLDESFGIEEIKDVNVNDYTANERETLTVKPKRFKVSTEEDIEKIKQQNTEKKTDYQTTWAVRLLKEWMQEAEYGTTSFEWLETHELDSLLERFYAAVQTKEGEHYSKSSLVGVRAGINRHLTSTPVSRIINIMKDREFQASNQVLSGMIKSLKRQGKDISTHKEPIEETDITKLYDSGVFSQDTPSTLQNKVLFDVISQFGRRGREGLRSLQKSSFKISVDGKERRYVKMAFNEADKTHHGLDSREKLKEPRMYETSGQHCPLKSFEMYLGKLNPNSTEFFQRPLSKPTSDIWYAARPVGINTLSTFMARMSEEAGLSRTYTNHCIRAYISTTLHEKGFSNRAIMSVTGHRNESSLTSYVKPSEDEREALSRALGPSSSHSAQSMVRTASSNNHIATECDSQSSANYPTHPCEPNTVDVNVLQRSGLHMFSGSITNSTVTVNMYQSSK